MRRSRKVLSCLLKSACSFSKPPRRIWCRPPPRSAGIGDQVWNTGDLFQKAQKRQGMELVKQVAGHRPNLLFIGTHQLDLGLAVVVVPVDGARLGELGQHGFSHIRRQKIVQVNMGKWRARLVAFGILRRQGFVDRVVEHKAVFQVMRGRCTSTSRHRRQAAPEYTLPTKAVGFPEWPRRLSRLMELMRTFLENEFRKATQRGIRNA